MPSAAADQKAQGDPEPRFFLPAPAVDTHFHALEMERRGMDAEGLLEGAFERGLAAAVEVAVDENDFPRRRAVAARFERLRLTAGIHPLAVSSGKSGWDERFELVRAQAAAPEVVGIGETGLDFFRDDSHAELQERAFKDHLELSGLLKKPVVIHNRGADAQVVKILRSSRAHSGILHCFSSDWETAKAVIDAGFYVSFAGNLTYKKSDAMRDAAARIPLDRLLIETDSPYLPPQAVRGRNNHPGHIGWTLKCLAEIRGMDAGVLASNLNKNAREVLWNQQAWGHC